MTKFELEYIHRMFQLHKLFSEGKNDEQADAIRDKMDRPWHENGELSNQQMNLISAWCQCLRTTDQSDREYLFKETNYDLA